MNSWTKQAGAGRYDFWRDYEPHWDNETHITDLLNAEAVRVIENHVKEEDSGPFFLYLSHTAPHDPLLPHPRHLAQCAHIENRARRLSCGMVAGIDEGVGDIVRLLEKHKILDNTIIAYSHDNGGVPYAGALNYPLKGAKATAYEGGVRSEILCVVALYITQLILLVLDLLDLFMLRNYSRNQKVTLGCSTSQITSQPLSRWCSRCLGRVRATPASPRSSWTA